MILILKLFMKEMIRWISCSMCRIVIKLLSGFLKIDILSITCSLLSPCQCYPGFLFIYLCIFSLVLTNPMAKT